VSLDPSPAGAMPTVVTEAVGVSAETARMVVGNLGLLTVRSAHAVQVRVAPGIDANAVQASLPSFRLLIDASIGPTVTPAMRARLHRHWDQPGFALLCRTQVAYACPLATLITAALDRVGVLPAQMLAPVRLSLHEAVANAVMHGNLDLNSLHQADDEAFLDFSTLFRQRLQDPAYGDRPLLIDLVWGVRQLDLAVLDCGPGYDPAELGESRLDDVSGRGLALIRSMAQHVAVSDDGRCTELRFVA